MNKIFNISLILSVVVLAGCATPDPYYVPQANTYGKPTQTNLGETAEGAGTTNSAYRMAERVQQEESMMVSWDLTLYPSNTFSSYGPQRSDCEVLVKAPGSLSYNPYDCDRVERVGRDFMVYYHYEGKQIVINLQTMPGNFLENGYCENGGWSPAQRMTARVVWSTHETVRPSNGLRRWIGCKPT